MYKWQDVSKLPLFKDEDRIRVHARKAEDPRDKPGIIGAYCRAWTIPDQIAEHMSHIYAPGHEESGKPRYTYSGGTASNGAVVEDQGRFLYSWHGSDPVGEQLVNAWDLYRIHIFGKLDEGVDLSAVSMMNRPSSKAMLKYAKADLRCQAEVVRTAMLQLEELFDGDVDEASDTLADLDGAV